MHIKTGHTNGVSFGPQIKASQVKKSVEIRVKSERLDMGYQLSG